MFNEIRSVVDAEIKLFGEFLKAEGVFWSGVSRGMLGWAGEIKRVATRLMYRQRGRFSSSFVHASMAVLTFLAVVLSSRIEALIFASEQETENNLVMSDYAQKTAAETLISELPKGEVTDYRVEEGDTVSSIAQKFGISIDTIMWENSLKSVDAIKAGQILKVLPVTGIRHKVKRGETVHSIAKRYSVDAQNIVDYPFNVFSNDETFALVAGQELMVPEGIKPRETIIDTSRYTAKTVAPVPGVVGEGSFMWPTGGYISQKFSWYHQAVDIANPGGPDVVAAQGGSVVAAGWSGGGYGNYVVIDHGNGNRTLYAHMANKTIVVSAGQVVRQGQKLGNMGTTGRSSGIHLHFEIITGKGKVNPLTVLK